MAELVDSNKVDNPLPYLASDFLQTLDGIQSTLMIDSKLFQKRIENYSIVESISALKKYVSESNRSILMRTKDEIEMEQILIDLL